MQGWANTAVDKVFHDQRHRADNTTEESELMLHNMMINIAKELNQATSGFDISRPGTEDDPKAIMDFCMASGGFLEEALRRNPGSRALAFTLPVENGGHEVLLPHYNSVSVKFLDINMLAEDMGAIPIPPDHEEAGQFLPRQLSEGKRSFDMALCDGQVRRTHIRAEYRERREANRLNWVQLALGLEHLKEGGTMIVLMHKVEAWRSVRILHQFSKFATVKVFKPSRAHNTRSSFYMVVSDIQVFHPEAAKAVEGWKKMWNAATFGTEEDVQKIIDSGQMAQEVLDEFGDTLVGLGTKIWKIQGDALTEKGWGN